MPSVQLSKSRILSGLQCPRQLFLNVNRPDLAEVDEGVERRFAAGHEVGEVARKLHPEGILIGHDRELGRALAQTENLLAEGASTPLFEATFAYGGVLVRVDVLVPGAEGLDLIEVKSSAEVKDYHLPDVAIQTWVVENLGYAVNRVFIAHVDTSFTYKVEGDYQGLLRYVDVTEQVRTLTAQVEGWALTCENVLLDGVEPDVEPGEQCQDPFPCAFQSHCIPSREGYPVQTLPRAGKLIERLLEEGIEDIRDIPAGRLTNSKHERMREAIIAGKAYLSPEAGEIVRALEYPRYYLDFETITFAVPRWFGTRPYQQLPFQWSCHIEDRNGELRHEEFLDISGKAPMRAFAEALIAAVGEQGPVVVYNAGFEKSVMRRLAEYCPDLSEKLNAVIDRVFDLLPIMREHYYHPDMHGSWSIKAVLPTVAPDLDYTKLDSVQHGGAAQDAYLICSEPTTVQSDRARLRESLMRYCEMDTLGMVRIAHFAGSPGES